MPTNEALIRRLREEIERLEERINDFEKNWTPKAENERMRDAGNALANASMVCPEDLDEQREAWRDALKGEVEDD